MPLTNNHLTAFLLEKEQQTGILLPLTLKKLEAIEKHPENAKLVVSSFYKDGLYTCINCYKPISQFSKLL